MYPNIYIYIHMLFALCCTWKLCDCLMRYTAWKHISQHHWFQPIHWKSVPHLIKQEAIYTWLIRPWKPLAKYWEWEWRYHYINYNSLLILRYLHHFHFYHIKCVFSRPNVLVWCRKLIHNVHLQFWKCNLQIQLYIVKSTALMDMWQEKIAWISICTCSK